MRVRNAFRVRTAPAALALSLAVALAACEGGMPVTALETAALLRTGVVASVRVTPGVETVPFGGAMPLAALAVDAGGHEVASSDVAWTSADTSVVSVSPSGVVTGRAAGWTLVTATVEGMTGTSLVTVSGAPVPAQATLVAAGDIASCGSQGDEATAALLAGIGGTVAPLGDNVYMSGTAAEFRDCYEPSWGRYRMRTRPAVGNHEYSTSGAAPYYAYFGPAAGAAGQGYYSYDLGAWHVVVLNSNCGAVSCAPGSAQERWLRADLAAHPAACTLAYWHHPRFNSGTSHGGDATEAQVKPFWDALYEHGAELVLNGHEHVYERFAPQTPDGAADAVRGVRQFTVGTGGKSAGTLGTRRANSEVGDASTYGVLRLTLTDGGYDWQFVPIAGGAFTDAGTGSCH
jgi:acid phosphatase type 7